MRLEIDDSIVELFPGCRLGCSVIKGVSVRGTPPALAQEFLGMQSVLAREYNLEHLTEVPRIAAVRRMYKRMEFDPSRYRPASEAMVRRILQGKGLYYVNSAVDVNNYCSLKFLLPLGLYDLDKISGDVHYRRADTGAYVNIAGKTVSTDSKPFLMDSVGPFGNPTSDSARTAVTLGTTNLLSIIFADEDIGVPDLADMTRFTAEMLVRYNGGSVEELQVVAN